MFVKNLDKMKKILNIFKKTRTEEIDSAIFGILAIILNSESEFTHSEQKEILDRVILTIKEIKENRIKELSQEISEIQASFG